MGGGLGGLLGGCLGELEFQAFQRGVAGGGLRWVGLLGLPACHCCTPSVLSSMQVDGWRVVSARH